MKIGQAKKDKMMEKLKRSKISIPLDGMKKLHLRKSQTDG